MQAKLPKKVDTQSFDVDTWHTLQSLTEARIGLGRAGVSLPTSAQLSFNADHAKARDAVNTPIEFKVIADAFEACGLTSLILHSKAQSRTEYLQRPDFGRRLNTDSSRTLESWTQESTKEVDIAIALVDGLSSAAVQVHGVSLVQNLSSALKRNGYGSAPIFLVEQGRVAIGDEIGEHVKAKAMILVIGERPGLSAHDSLGIYYTYMPRLGLTDANRNCISNIRPKGMSIDQASEKALWLVKQSFERQLSGVNLKDTAQMQSVLEGEQSTGPGNFLLRDHKNLKS